MLPDVFPVRDFPITTTTTAAVYLQDEIGLAGGALRLVPALRVDHYELAPESDPVSYTQLDVYKRQAPGCSG